MPRYVSPDHRRAIRWVQDRISSKTLKQVMPAASAEAWEQLIVPRRTRWCDPEHAETALADLALATALLDQDGVFAERKPVQDGYAALITLTLEAAERATGAGSFSETDDLLEVVRQADERLAAVASHTKRRRLIDGLRKDKAQDSPAPPLGPPRLRVVR